jgi:hypothetical protein
MTTFDTTRLPDWKPKAHRVALASLAAAAAILLAGVLVAWLWRHDLPDPVATHWSGSKVPDGFGRLMPTAWGVLGGLGLPTCALMAAIGWLAGRTAAIRRLMAGLTVGTAVFLAVTFDGTLVPQRGLADAAQVGPDAAEGYLVLALVAAVVAGCAALPFIRSDPPLPATDPVDPGAPQVTLKDGERAVWVGRARVARGYFVTLGAVTLLFVVLLILVPMWFMVLMTVLTLALMLAFAWITVRVDQAGLHVRGAFGWPRSDVPADEVLEAHVEPVNPLADFGGWGWRLGRDRHGVVVRRGDAIVVTQTGDRTFVVTVDDAATGAALLNTYAARSR